MMLRSMVLVMLAVGPGWAAEGSFLKVDVRSDQVAGAQELGALQVEILGTVKFTATREGKRIILQAVGDDGKVVGRAESVVGISETPIYIQTPKGLKKLTILWKGP